MVWSASTPFFTSHNTCRGLGWLQLVQRWRPISGVTGRIDTSLFTRVVKRFTYLALRTKNIHQQCVSFSRTNYTWSDRNFCAGLLLGFVPKRPVTIWRHLSFTRDVLQRRFSAQHSDNYDAKMPSFTAFSGRLKQARTKFSLILILNMVLRNSSQGVFA